MKVTSFTKSLTILALGAALATVGCGGGGGGGGGSGASTAAGAASGTITLSEARAEHTAVVLPSGEIFVAGGFDVAGKPMRSTAIISPTGVKAGPDLNTARVGHTATLMSNGQILIAGGQSDAAGSQILASTEVFDSLTSSISAGPSLGSPRSRHIAMRYLIGNAEHVLIAGGIETPSQTGSVAYVSSAEDVDGSLAVTPLAASLSQPMAGAKAALLDTGNILIVGGEGPTGPAQANLFDVQQQTFTPVASAVVTRAAAAVASKGGEVLVAGGIGTNGKEASTEVFDSVTSVFAQGISLGEARSDMSALVANGGEVVLIGGRDAVGASKSIERLIGSNLGQATLKKGNDLNEARYAHTASVLPTSTNVVYVIGGYDAAGVPLASVEKVDLNATVASSSSSATTTGSPTTTTTGTTPGTIPGSIPGTGVTTGGTTTGGTTTGGTTTGGTTTGGTTTGGTTSSGGTGGSSILNTVLQAAIAALTATTGSGSSFSFSTFMQAFVQNLMTGLLGGSGGSGGVLSSLLSGLLGGGSGSTSGSTGSSGLLSSLLGGLLGGSGSSTSGGSSSGGIGGVLSSLLGGLLGGSGSSTSGGSSSSTGGIGGLLSGLLGGLFGGGSGSTSGSTGSTGGSTGGSTAPTPSVTGVTPGQGPVGTSVTVTVDNVNLGAGASVRVTINGTAMALTSANLSGAGVLTVVGTVSAGSTTGPLMVELIPASGAATPVAGPNFTVL